MRLHGLLWHTGPVTRFHNYRSRWAPRAAALIAVGIAALALRLIHLHAVWSLMVDELPPPGMDRWLNMQIASAIAEGDWLGGWAAPFDSSPGYSYALAVLYSLSGRHWAVPLIVQLVLGATTPLLVYDIGRRHRGHAVGLVAALLAALYQPAIFYEGLLVKFSLVPVTTAFVLLALLRVRDGELRWALPAGLALGGLALLRPNMLVVAPVVATWASLGAGGRVAIQRSALLAAGAAVLLVPMSVRDHLAGSRGRAAALGGIHFYIGTNPKADGEYVVLDGIRPDIVGHVVDARREAERRVGRTLSGPEVSRFWFERGLAFIRADPIRYARLEARKLRLSLDASESGSFGDDFDSARQLSPVLGLPLVTFGTVAPLGFVGLVGCIRRRQLLLPLFVCATLVSLLPFFIAGRYRLPLAPPMIVLAAIGIDGIDGLMRRHGRAALAMVVPGLALGAVVLGDSDAQVLTLFVALGLGLLVVRHLDRDPSRFEIAERP